MYGLVKTLLFQFNPEDIHHFVVKRLRWFNQYFPGGASILKASFVPKGKNLQREVFGIKFKNPVGLAAGFDKNGEYIEALSNLGFGFIEVGTVTPLPQPGNDKPRMFRLCEDEAIINRMGFNNKGVDTLAERLRLLKSKRPDIIIGGNIGKNKLTPNEEALSDYTKCFDALFDVVDYFVVNVSSPNTPGLRALQEKGPLLEILANLQKRNHKNGISRPILLKIAPDLSNEQLDDIIEIVEESGIAGLIASNTTIERNGLQSKYQKETGGLSGKPLTKRSTEVIRYLSEKSGGKIPIIGVGGIHTAEDAQEKLAAGAVLVQLFSGFIYEGPALVKRICNRLAK